MSDTRRATLLGFLAILMWASLALLTARTGRVPPLQLLAMSFAVGGAVGLVWLLPSGRGTLAMLRAVPGVVWLIGIGGLFGYHLAYYTALRHAPVAQASLIAYLWPLLIVLGSGLLPEGEPLRARHVVGAALAFAGAGLLLTARDGGGTGDALGYGAAAACALIWSAYSLLSRRFGTSPTAAVAVFCLATALLALPLHLAFEQTVWPQGGGQWAAVIALGLMPVGAAFYLWDVGCKRGDMRLLGVLAYAAPLLSTLLLVAAGEAEPDGRLALSALAITAGALVASGWRPQAVRAR